MPRLKRIKKVDLCFKELRQNKKDAIELLKYFFTNEIMSGDMYKVVMSQAVQIQSFLLKISKFKTT